MNDTLRLDDTLSPKGPNANSDESPAYAFSYFDCTDCKDCIEDNTTQRRLLTFAREHKLSDKEGGIGRFEHLWLLVCYLRCHINVHGGYFEGKTVYTLIYRLACLGYQDAVAAYLREYNRSATGEDNLSATGKDALSKVCSESQIKVRLSDRLDRPARATSPMILETIDDLKGEIERLTGKTVADTVSSWQNSDGRSAVEHTNTGLNIGGLGLKGGKNPR